MPFDRKMEGANIRRMLFFFVKYALFLFSTSIRADMAVQGPLVFYIKIHFMGIIGTMVFWLCPVWALLIGFLKSKAIAAIPPMSSIQQVREHVRWDS